MKKALLAVAMGFLATAADSNLVPGDLLLVGYNADNPDEVAVVALAPIASGEVINFTDCGWTNDHFRLTENFFTLTVTNDIPAGATLVLAPNYTNIYGTIAGSAGFATTGDQCFLYQGDNATPTLLFGLTTYRDVWQSVDVNIDAANSQLPAALVGYNVALGNTTLDIDNALYAGIRTGTVSEIVLSVTTPANWTRSDTRLDLTTLGDFEIIPEPLTWVLFGFSGLAMLVRRWMEG